MPKSSRLVRSGRRRRGWRRRPPPHGPSRPAVVDLAAAPEGHLLGGVLPRTRRSRVTAGTVAGRTTTLAPVGPSQPLLRDTEHAARTASSAAVQLVQGLVERPLEEVLLARHVVVVADFVRPSSRARSPMLVAFIALPVEELDRDPRRTAGRRPGRPRRARSDMDERYRPTTRPPIEGPHRARPEPAAGDLDRSRPRPSSELRALQLQRLQWTLRHAYDHVPSLPRRRSTRPASVPTTSRRSPTSRGSRSRRKATCARTTPSGCSRCPRGRRTPPRLERHHGQADGRRLHRAATSTCGPTWSLARSAPRAAGAVMILHNAYGYGLFTGGLGAHYGAERLGWRWCRSPAA